VYIRDDLNYIILDDSSVNIDGKFESIFVEARSKTINCIFGEIYRVSNTSETYETTLNKLQHIKKDIALRTDQSFDNLKYTSQTHISELIDLFLNAGFLPPFT